MSVKVVAVLTKITALVVAAESPVCLALLGILRDIIAMNKEVLLWVFSKSQWRRK